MDRITTQTLYEMVKEWTVQLWDGTRYSHIVETLWDSIEACGLIEGPFGMAMTLLESYVVDSAEEVDAGLIDMNQAVEGPAKQTRCAEYQTSTVCCRRFGQSVLRNLSGGTVAFGVSGFLWESFPLL